MAVVQIRGRDVDTADVDAVRALSDEEFLEALAAAVAQDQEQGSDMRSEQLFPSADPEPGSAIVTLPR